MYLGWSFYEPLNGICYVHEELTEREGLASAGRGLDLDLDLALVLRVAFPLKVE